MELLNGILVNIEVSIQPPIHPIEPEEQNLFRKSFSQLRIFKFRSSKVS